MESSKTASVYLLMQNISQSGTSINHIGGLCSFTGLGGKHWAVLVQFENEDFFYICEITRIPETKASGSGLIDWRCEKITDKEIQRDKVGNSIEYLGKCYLTPNKLRKHCNDIDSNNTKYNLITNNCQHWCKNLIKKLNVSIWKFFIKRFFIKPTAVITYMGTGIMVGIMLFSR
ncbi:PREDICTED: uncharacterized protein LOC108559598 [Nicrophorus vespilloides]|uniref:Uncharacterized protein LOC108559598 n=1 Tax=Nicrophorus vespilloides TaxID=110193 RepID=A0ABM1MCW8_NICVS|nr:PREDICTED: uncharacterized protein LOC108559598 [Nicrophorus vespilloides]